MYIYVFSSMRIIYMQGVLHTTGGYMLYTATTFKYAFDYKQSDIYWFAPVNCMILVLNIILLKKVIDGHL